MNGLWFSNGMPPRARAEILDGVGQFCRQPGLADGTPGKGAEKAPAESACIGQELVSQLGGTVAGLDDNLVADGPADHALV